MGVHKCTFEGDETEEKKEEEKEESNGKLEEWGKETIVKAAFDDFFKIGDEEKIEERGV